VSALLHGIHHVTCISGDAQENVDFYTRVMGLRLVKRSVNQDEPHTYHLFYADGVGTPGTDLTFFPWPDRNAVQQGPGLASEVTFAVPPGALAWWRAHLATHSVPVAGDELRFGEETLLLRDPHGLPLALVETKRPRAFVPWSESAVPAGYQLRGIDAVRMGVRNVPESTAFITGVLGFGEHGKEGEWTRFALAANESGTMLDVRAVDGKRGRWGRGGVHHVAWRVADQDALADARGEVEQAGRRPTPLIDRFWFKSVYFLEPGGVLFELATDGPGFSRDESASELGERLVLPPWLEPSRVEIEGGLPVLRVG
jgi:glyoxalase family protein